MKKSGYLGLVFLFILVLGFVSAIDTSSIDQQFNSVDEKVQDVTSKVETTKSIVTNEDVRNAYLKKQLVSILEDKPFFKQVISGYRKISPYSNPIVEFAMGMTPELSLFFILVLVIWFFLVKYYFTTYDVLNDLSLFSKSTTILISLSFFCILLLLRIFQSISLFLANKLVALTEFLTSPIMKIVSFVVFVVGIIFLSKFSKEVKILARYIRMKINKSERENKEKELLSRQESATKVAETIAKAMTGEK
jgi:hypothetical protein